jgi:insulysin
MNSDELIILNKAPNDNNIYGTFKMKNGLAVIVIQNDKTKIASAAMDIKIGSNYDTLSGIAHFLEHMLFMGTTKYPSVNTFFDKLALYSGEANAYTGLTNTCYYYCVNNDNFMTMLDIFAQFFISPLLDKKSINKEVNAVDSEYKKNLYDINMHLVRLNGLLAIKNHVINNFTCGNLKELLGENLDENNELHERVKQFYHDHYTANNMTLIIYSSQDINSVKESVEKMFMDVPKATNNQVLPHNKTSEGRIFQYPQIAYLVPFAKDNTLIIQWEGRQFNDSGLTIDPFFYLGHIFGHEGENSLCELLRAKQYITSLIFSSAPMCGREILRFDLTLTESGMDHYKELVNYVYNYIKFVKKNIHSEHIKNLFREPIILKQKHYLYDKKNTDATSTILNIVSISEQYPKIDLKNINDFYMKNSNHTSDQIILSCLKGLKLLKPKKSIVIISSQRFATKTDKVDVYYKFNYKITDKRIKYKKNNIQFVYPPINNYLSIDSVIYENQMHGLSGEPELLENKNILCYWKPDYSFNEPNVNIQIRIAMPRISDNKKLYIQFELLLISIMQSVNSELYLCYTAGYIVSITPKQHTGITLYLYGNVNKIEAVCEKIVEIINNKKINNDILEMMKNKMKNLYANKKQSPPYVKIYDDFNKEVFNSYCSYDDYSDFIDNIDSHTYTNTYIFDELFEDCNVCMLIYGNVIKQTSINILNIFSKLAFIKDNKQNISKNTKNTKTNTITNTVTNTISAGITHRNIQVVNKHEKNTAVLYSVFVSEYVPFVTPGWEKLHCFLLLLCKILNNQYFYKLRTQEQFGYVVSVKSQSFSGFANSSYNTNFISFLVQSPKKTFSEIIKRTDEFILDFNTYLNELTLDGLAEYIKNIRNVLQAPKTSIIDAANDIFINILLGNPNFNYYDIIVDALHKITKKELCDFYNERFIEKKHAITVAISS